jgi:hypothetical protein
MDATPKKLNPYIVTLVAIGLTSLGLAIVLARVADIQASYGTDAQTLAGLGSVAEVALYTGIGGILGALIAGGASWRRSPSAEAEAGWSISYPESVQPSADAP